MSKTNLSDEWPKIKQQLLELGREARDLAKKGESQLTVLSHQGKLRINAASLSLQRERLLYQIGKAYVAAKRPGTPNKALTALVEEFRRVEKDLRALKRKLSADGGAGPSRAA